MLRRIIIGLIVNALALALAAYLVQGIDYGSWVDLLLVALVFGVVNAIVKPIAKLLTCPLTILTLGLFLFVLNALMLWLTSWVSGLFGLDFTVDGFWPALWGSLIISVVGLVANILFKDD